MIDADLNEIQFLHRWKYDQLSITAWHTVAQN